MMEYELIRSKRKSVAIEVTGEGEVLVRAPLRMKAEIIEKFVGEHEDWIKEKVRIAELRRPEPLSEEEIAQLKRKAAEVLPARTAYYADLMGLKPTGVKITSAHKRFGSCSGKNSICYSYQLMRYPEAAIDYVVVHELAHIKHKNHGRDFYALIERYLPDYKERAALLRQKPERSDEPSL